ncbi:MAG TPA: hypothetical protein VNG35_14795 [Gemmatimonadales bacterium]|nr:hypothetical protein [Gemmatimonadales bacterium]
MVPSAMFSWLRHLPDRMLHHTRRRAAIRTLQEGLRPSHILILCHGNICRSPFAAELLQRQLLRSRVAVRIRSGGFLASGRGAPPEAQEAASYWNIDLTAHRSRHASPELIRGADLIVVMEPAQRWVVAARFGRPMRDVVVLGDLDLRPAATRAIPDPWGRAPAAYVGSYARIARCIAVLAALLRRLPAGAAASSERANHWPTRTNGNRASEIASITPGFQSTSLNSS